MRFVEIRLIIPCNTLRRILGITYQYDRVFVIFLDRKRIPVLQQDSSSCCQSGSSGYYHGNCQPQLYSAAPYRFAVSVYDSLIIFSSVCRIRISSLNSGASQKQTARTDNRFLMLWRFFIVGHIFSSFVSSRIFLILETYA